jgi:RsiW-degrading membrane proteinase PrsW (M82 family)
MNRDGAGVTASRMGKVMTRDNLLYLVIGALVVAVAVLGYRLYETKKEPTGVHINLGERGLSIEAK